GFSFQVSDGLGGTNTAAIGITVNPVNDAPGFVKGADQTVLEDSGAQTVPGWATAISAGPADEAVQGLTFNITGNSNPALFSAGPAVAADGTLTYTPAANASGSATITLTLSDLGGTANGGVNTSGPQEFIINVTPVNDAPSFTKGADQTVLEDAAPQTIPNWATAISAGANESGQTVSFVIVSNDNPSLFSAGPAVSPTGTLTYTLAANRNGVANLSVRIQDDGGTANGGVNESPAQSFTITVTAVNDKPFMTGAPKSFSAQANMRINGLGGLLAGASDANDPENGSPAFTVGAIGGAAASSVLNINAATGTFDFNPPAGATGAHTFNYVICDNGVPLPAACSDPINVTVNIAGPVIWFVNGAAAAGGNGTLSAPFQTLAQANAVDAANHRIFLHSGTYANGIPLNSGEWLIGQGVTGFASFDSLMGITPPAGTVARPAVATGSVTVQGNVVLAPTTVLKALAINVTGSTEGLSGSSATGVDVVQTSVSSATGRAVNFNTVTGAISLISVSSNGAPSGISLASHTGSFAVLGTGSANTGGLIQNSTGDGVVMNGAENVSFKDLRVISSSDNNLDARSVNGLVLDRSTFDTTPGGAPADLTSRHNFYGNTITNLTIQNGTVLDGGTTNQVNIHNVKIDNLLGASVIDNSTIRDGKDMNVLIQNFTATNFAGTPDSITIRNNTRIQNPSPGTIPGDNVQIRAENNANMSVTITGGAAGNSQFTGASQNVVQLLAEGPGAGPSGKMIASISNAIMTGANGPAINLNAGQTGSLTATVSGLTLASALSSPINIVNFDTSTIKATITGNTLSSPAQGGLGGINHEAEGGGTITSLITNNNISGKMDNGIFANPKKPGSKINLTATNNTINIDAGSLHGIAVVTGLSDGSGGNAGVCLNLTNNNATAPGGSGYRFNNRAGTIFQLQGYVGGATSTSDVAAWVASKGNVGTVSATIPAGASYTAATCAVP
ncbi:MAG TPA: Ig-like domain-containing protein, partial [Bryobacteraceae bacterium]|nr:Ig-like domain-containing protein [Bryobacteraceae bacterium]